MSESTIRPARPVQDRGRRRRGISQPARTAAGSRRKFVNVGVGSRSRMYLTAITKTFAEGNELVGICDVNPGRLDVAAKFVAPNGGKPKKYLAADFDKMLKEPEARLRHRHLPRRVSR